MTPLVGARTIRPVQPGTDAERVLHAREGDQASWADLVGSYVGMVHAICRCYRLGDDDAEAVGEVVWLRLVEQLPRLVRPDAVGGWIAATCRAECLRVLRASGRIVAPGDDVGIEATAPDGSVAPDPESLRDDGDRAHLRAVAGLGIGCRRLLRLLVAEPRPTADQVGAALDMAPDWVGPAGERCLAQVHAALGRGPVAPADEALLSTLRRVVEATDPVPAGWQPVALDCFAWHDHDAAVAPVVYDSTDQGRPYPGGAGTSETRRVGYAVPGGSLEIEMVAGELGVRVGGRLQPGQPVRVLALWRRGSLAAEADRAGRFRFDELPVRPVSFLVETEPAVKTSWIVP